MATVVAPDPFLAGDSCRRRTYGVGLRVFTDRRLLRQIRAEIVRNGMRAAEIAALENVSTEVLATLLDARLAEDGGSGAALRRYATNREGFVVAAWHTTRGRPSKLHILDATGTALCGTPIGGALAAVHAGPCGTCAGHAGIAVGPSAGLAAA